MPSTQFPWFQLIVLLEFHVALCHLLSPSHNWTCAIFFDPGVWDSFMISFLNRCDFLFDPISVSAARMMSFSFLQIDRFTCTSTWHSLKPKEPQDLLVYLVCLTKVVPGWSLSCVFVMSVHTATLLKLECCFQICSGKQHKKTTSYGT